MTVFDNVEIKVPAKPQYVSVVRLTISGLAIRVGFSYDEIEDLKIAISEAVTNVVQHAYGESEEGDVIISASLYPNRMEIKVSDSGNSFNVEEVKTKTGPYHVEDDVDQLREGGLGLYLMEALMDEVKINNNGGVTVFMTKYVSREQVVDHGERITP